MSEAETVERPALTGRFIFGMLMAVMNAIL